MTLSSNAILFIGYGLTGIFATMGFLKVLRSNKRLILITIIAVVVAFWGFILSSTKADADAENVIAILAGPLIYVLLYTLLRYVYKVIYKVEPTYNRMSWYDEEEGRRQNWMDVFVHVVPMLIAFAFPLAFM